MTMLNGKPTFRAATLTDLSDLFRLMRQLYEDDAGTQLKEAEVLAPLTELLTSSAYGRVYVAILDGQVVGSMVICFGFSLEFRGRDAFIDEFVIDRDHRSQGIGRELLEFVVADIANNHIRAVHLEVKHGNRRAAAFYHDLGFVDHPRHLSTRWLKKKQLTPHTE